jgi:hypothetical protein
MKVRSVVTTAVASVLLVGLLAPASAIAKKSSGPTVVGTDDAADWGVNADPTLTPLGGPLGQELVEASIGMADAKTINFVIKVASLPPSGGVPEASRYNWDFTVNGTAYQLTGAFTDYLRGVCNPLHTGACPPPQDPGQQPFFLRQGSCLVGEDCFLLDTFNATFDAAEATITIPVPLAAIKAKPGSKIGPGATSLGGTVYAAPAVMVTQAAFPHDTMTILKTFVVPKG